MGEVDGPGIGRRKLRRRARQHHPFDAVGGIVEHAGGPCELRQGGILVAHLQRPVRCARRRRRQDRDGAREDPDHRPGEAPAECDDTRANMNHRTLPCRAAAQLLPTVAALKPR